MIYRTATFSMFVLLVGCAFTLRAQSRSAPDELLESITSFYAAIETADAEVRINLLADDVILMPNHWTMLRGKDTVSEVFRSASGRVFKLRDREVLSMEVSGDIAYTVNSYYYTYNEKNEEEQWHKTKNVHIWRRGSSGQWKLVVDIWNSDVPIAQFALE
jgi:ketosteroid isomerase-like protein